MHEWVSNARGVLSKETRQTIADDTNAIYKTLFSKETNVIYYLGYGGRGLTSIDSIFFVLCVHGVSNV